MDSLLSLIKFLAQTNVINFLLMAGILVWIVRKLDMANSMENSVVKIKESIFKSEQEKEIAQKKVQHSRELFKKLPQEVEFILNTAKEKEQILKSELETSAQKSLENLHKNSEKLIQIEEKKISDEITKQTIVNSIEQSRKDIVRELEANPDLHRQFILDSLNEFERMEF